MFELFKPFIPYIAAVLLLLGVYTIGHIKGSSSCEVKHAKAVSVAIQKESQHHEEVKKKVMRLSDPDLDKRLSKWLRD